MAGAAQTAVLVPVAAVEPVVGVHRARLDRSASWGVPAHVSVVYPFVALDELNELDEPDELDEPALARLASAVASVAAFDCTFARCAWFGEDVLWLAPDPDDGFRALTDAVVGAFPQHPPYGGVFAEVIPHLTVGERRRGSSVELRAAEQAVAAHLPVAAHVDHVVVMTGTDAAGSWRTIHRVPLGSAPGRG